jgi:L-lactate dehydrogenase (cytochrome)
MPALKDCHNIADLCHRAFQKLPSPMFHYIDGGADDEWTLCRNADASNDYGLQPHYLNDNRKIDVSTRVLGCDLKLPFFLSPTGMSRLFHHDKELGGCESDRQGGDDLHLVDHGDHQPGGGHAFQPRRPAVRRRTRANRHARADPRCGG